MFSKGSPALTADKSTYRSFPNMITCLYRFAPSENMNGLKALSLSICVSMCTHAPTSKPPFRKPSLNGRKILGL